MDQKWLVVRTICCTTQNQTRRTCNALSSFLEFAFLVFRNSLIIFAGYADQDNWDEIVRQIGLYLTTDRYRIVKFPIEIGKSIILNRIISKYADPQCHQWVMCSDADIIFPKLNWGISAAHLLECWSELASQIDYIALQQTGDSRHNPGLFMNQPEIDFGNGQKIAAYNSYVGIAGGAFSFSMECWLSIGGIPNVYSQYGPEDVLLLKELARHSRRTCIWLDLIVEHPWDPDIIKSNDEWNLKLQSSLHILNKNQTRRFCTTTKQPPRH